MNVEKYLLKCNKADIIFYKSCPEFISYDNDVIPFVYGRKHVRFSVKGLYCSIAVDDKFTLGHFEYRFGALYYIIEEKVMMVFYKVNEE